MRVFARLSSILPSAPYRALWRIHNLRWLALTNFFGNITLYSTVIVAYEQSRGLNYTGIFGLESVISVAILICNIPTGVWADQFGYRRILLLGRILCALSLLPYLFGYGFVVLASGSLLFGAGVACISGCESALVYESLPDAKTGESDAAFALLGAFASAGFLFGLCFGSFLAAYSIELPVVLNSVPMVCAVLATLKLSPHPQPLPRARERGAESPHPRPLSSAEERGKQSPHPQLLSHRRGEPEVARALIPAQEGVEWVQVICVQEKVSDGQAAEGRSMGVLLRSAARLLRERPALAGLSLVDSAAFALVNAIFWYNQPFFTRAGIALIWFGPITAAVVGVEMLVTLTTPVARKRFGVGGALALCLAVSGLAYLALAVARAPLIVVLLVLLVAMGNVWRQPLINAELNRHIATGARATTLSVLSFIGTLAGVALNPLIGHVGDLGLLAVGLSLGAAILLLAALAPLFILWAQKHKR
jgi:MFS family permease